MKDRNLNSKSPDSDTANGNDVTDNISCETNTNEDVNRNAKALKNSKIMNTIAADPNSDADLEAKDTLAAEPNSDADLEAKDTLAAEPNSDAALEAKDTLAAEPNSDAALEAKDTLAAEPNSDAALEAACDNGTEKVGVVCKEGAAPSAPATEEPAPNVFVPKYKYTDDQWSPLKTSGTKCYDLGLLKQIRDDPRSMVKPDIPMLDTCKLIRETVSFTAISRPVTDDALFPSFARGGGGGGGGGSGGGGGGGARNTGPRDHKKDGRNITPSGKGSVKLSPHPSQPQKPVIRVLLSQRDDVKLNESENAWKPTRYKVDAVTEEEAKTLELYKQFRGILNKLTPQKFDTLMQKVQQLEITTQRQLEGVIDLVFEKAIEEPNFCEAYAHMCHKLYGLKVPADNATSPEQCVNFRALIITKCQKQFETEKVDETVIKLEEELKACADPVKRKELQLQLVEENRKARMRSAGNVRFIGELYKLKMLTSKIMVFCMKYLVERLEEEKLECLCKLLTTIGQQLEGEARAQLDLVFRRMQQIVDRKSDHVSSRVRFMLQDVIELRRGNWVTRSVVDLQPKTLDQIQKEADQQQRHIEIMNAAPLGGRGRDDGGRGRRGGDARRQTHSQQDSGWKTPTKTAHYSVDTAKLKSLNKNVQNIKLAPPSWNIGSGAKSTNTPTLPSPSVPLPTATTNKYSVLAVEADDSPSTLTESKECSPGHPKGASIEKSTFISDADSSPTPAANPQPLPPSKKKCVSSSVRQYLDSGAAIELSADVQRLFPPDLHAALVAEILNFALEKSPKDIARVAEGVLHLVGSGTVAVGNLLAGLKDVLEVAPDLLIDVPMLYDYLAKFVAPLIEQKHTTFQQILNVSEMIISSQQGHLLLRAVIKEMKDSMGPTFVMNLWQESGLQINQWMSDDQVSKFIQDNGLEFLEGGAEASEEAKETQSHTGIQSESLRLINNDDNCESIRGSVKV